ncbi:MAG TPA: hypothetical protein VJ781_10755, partial [Pyrinomonadaceae bacterium]|nr:hypothetical protein [Pyrinomonadaceae bacterium]
MPRKRFIDRIKVKDPCTQDWETMRGNDTVRFCDHCWKNVTDISTMTRKRAMKVVRKSKGSLCVRYLEEPRDHSPMFADRLTSLTRRAPSLATGAMGASLVLSTAAYAQGPVGQRAPQPQISNQEKSPTQKSKEPASPDLTAEISGTVTDPIGAVVPGA